MMEELNLSRSEPLSIAAKSLSDLNIISSLVQDSILRVGNVSWMPKSRRFAMLLDRFMWEDEKNARIQKRPFQRIQSTLSFEGVLMVKSKNIEKFSDKTLMWLLTIEFPQGRDNSRKYLNLVFAKAGVISLEIECIEVFLKDVSQPYISRVKNAPNHEDYHE